MPKGLEKTHRTPRPVRHGGGMRVVLIEDDPTISVPLADGLMRSGFDVVAVSTAADGLAAVDGSDLVLLDLGLPDLDGSEVCRRIRQTSSVPIIVISARGDEIDRVLLLESGADDYVVKPFGTRELIARIRAVARRTMPEEAPERHRELGPLTIDVAAHRAAMDGVELELTPKEFDLLAYLSSDLGVVHRQHPEPGRGEPHHSCTTFPHGGLLEVVTVRQSRDSPRPPPHIADAAPSFNA